MNMNHLLLWISARRQGSWMQFKAAVEELRLAAEVSDNDQTEAAEQNTAPGLPYHQIVRLNLQMLAHAEFFVGEDNRQWQVVPPSIAVHRQPERWIGVICGARSRRLLSQIEEPLPVTTEIHSIDGYPDQIVLTALSQEPLLECARKLNLRAQLEAPSAILLSSRSIADPYYRRPAALPFGKDWTVSRFSASSLKWTASTAKEAVRSRGALFHFSFGYRHSFFFCQNGDFADVPVRIGKFLALARRRLRIVRYDKGSESVFIPPSLRPPILIERALSLCSGLPASYDDGIGFLRYGNVPGTVAQFVSGLLCQEILQ